MESKKFPVVQSCCGPVKGVRKTTCLGRSYYNFNGVPYMKAPVGKLRFRDPEEREEWTEVFDATGPRPTYVAVDAAGKLEGQEDAGILSISTPYLDRKLPVAVYIHGGGFQFAFGTTDVAGPDYLLQNDFVYVTLNYRVGPIGFLSLKDPELGVPGNAGLKDQVMALKWIQKNIENFGGDPDNVTILGTSAGGVSCHMLMMSELANGLFHRAIPMSGSAFIKTWPFTSKSELTERLAKSLGWDGTGGERKILEILENTDVAEIVAAEAKLLTPEEIFNEHILFPFTPVIEPYESQNSFFTKDPVLLGSTSWSNDIDCIFGVTSLEGGLMKLFPGSDKYFDFIKKPEGFMPLQELGSNRVDVAKLGEKIQKLYFGDEAPLDETRFQYYQYTGDIHFGYGIYRAVMSRIKSGGKGKTYFYRFDAQTSLNPAKKFLSLADTDGACHGDDMGYLFPVDFEFMEEESKAVMIHGLEFGLVKKFTSMVSSFITTNDPNNLDFVTNFEPVTAEDHIRVLSITNDSFEMIPLPEKERFKVWDETLKEANVVLY